MSGWQSVETAPIEKAVLVWDGSGITVGRQYETGSWFVDNSHGFNEDGQIFDVTHWMPLPDSPNE